MKERVDLGHGFTYTFVQDGDVNPAGVILWRVEPREQGMVEFDPEEDPDLDHVYMAHAICIFDLPGLERNLVRWQLHSLDPLHLEPSIQMYDRHTAKTPTFHGHIRNGRWEPA